MTLEGLLGEISDLREFGVLLPNGKRNGWCGGEFHPARVDLDKAVAFGLGGGVSVRGAALTKL